MRELGEGNDLLQAVGGCWAVIQNEFQQLLSCQRLHQNPPWKSLASASFKKKSISRMHLLSQSIHLRPFQPSGGQALDVSLNPDFRRMIQREMIIEALSQRLRI